MIEFIISAEDYTNLWRAAFELKHLTAFMAVNRFLSMIALYFEELMFQHFPVIKKIVWSSTL